ncbi:AsmA-like C-terminal region-containing protein [Thermogutta sp.]|uniref:AsmA-like C-terminal region-containing protein n=1 Tax=Thermogutta sp. TaxID=1962930 RepID=UPI00321FF52A
MPHGNTVNTMTWRRLIQEIGFFLKWGLAVALVAGFFFAIWLYKRVDDELRSEIERRCAVLSPHLRIRIRSAQLLPGEGIQLRGVRITVTDLPKVTATIAEIEEIMLAGPVAYKELLSGDVPVERVIVRRPHVRIACGTDGQWNISRLLPLPKLPGSKHPPVYIENGMMEIIDLRGPIPSVIAYRDIQMEISSESRSQSDGSNAGSRKFRGTMTGDFVRRIDIEGTFDSGAPCLRLTGAVDSLELSPECQAAFPREVRRTLRPLEHLRAQLSLTFHIFCSAGSNPVVDYDLSGQVRRGRLDDPRLPYAITDIRGYFTAARDEVSFTDVTAFSGSTAFVVRSAKLLNWDLAQLADLDMQINHLKFDPALLPLLPSKLQEEWPKYFPEGTVHLTVRLTSLQGQRHFHVIANLESASFAYYRFPYRLQQVQGRLELTPERLGIQLVAMAGNQPVEIRGQVLNPLAGPVTQISISGQRIALDERLLNAVLDTKSRQTLRALHLSGSADVWLGLWQNEPGGVLHRQMEATLNGCSIRYEAFPYPISDITGRIVMRDDAWSFQELRGRSGPAEISAHGTLLPQNGSSTFRLDFEAKQLPLDNELKGAFRDNHIRQIWEELDPVGTVQVRGTILYTSGEPLDVKLWASPVDRGLTLQPRSCPYRLEGIVGNLTYEAGTLSFQGLRGHHENTEFQADGSCELAQSGGWSLDLRNLWVDRLIIDRALLLALPEALSRPLARLNIQGPVVVRGQFRLIRPHQASPGNSVTDEIASGRDPVGQSSPLQAAWNVVITLVQNSIGTSLVFGNLNGKIRFQGEYSEGNFTADGDLDLHALQVLGLPITRLQGPFRIANELIIFGGDWAVGEFARRSPTVSQSAMSRQPITAELFGGTLSGAGWVRLSDRFEYDVALSLLKADFPELVREYQSSSSIIRGTLDAAVRFKGQGDDIQGLAGYGNFQLREANVYELPLMIALLKILSVRQPDATAFSESSGQFRIAGRHVYLDSVTFSGDAFSLTGQGEVDLDGNLRLIMRAMLGRREIQVPVVKELFRGASEQIVLVHVGGTLKDPIVRREPFPGVNEALQKFQLGNRNPRGSEAILGER